MSAGDRIYACRGATSGGTSIPSAVYARISPSTVLKTDLGPAGATGRAASQVSYRGLGVELYLRDIAAAAALLEAAKATLVIQTIGSGGGNEKITLTNVKFLEGSAPLELAEKDQAGKAGVIGIKGIVLWGANDTFATVMVAAADAS